MGVFDDKKFEQLDWISQATEPIESVLNEFLGAVPDSFDLNLESYRQMRNSYSGVDITMSMVIEYFAEKYKFNFSWEESRVLSTCFAFKVEPNTIIDFEKQEIIGKISILKVVNIIEDKLLQGFLGRAGIAGVGSMYLPSGENENLYLSRANEIMELLAKCENGLRTRSISKKRQAIVNRLKTIFKDNEWNIKDDKLADKVGLWIRDYIMNGNLAAMSNFCRLKVMTHKGQPIYSMEEVL